MVSVRVVGKCDNPKRVADQYNRVLRTRFTSSERSELRKSGGIRVEVRQMGKGVVGGYSGMKGGMHYIRLDPRVMDDETITHETIHALQECDMSRPEIERELTTKTISEKKDKRTREELRTLKEAMTEAETLTRSEKLDRGNGYYTDLEKQKGGKARELKAKDRSTLRRDRSAIARKEYVTETYDKFPETEIKDLKLKDSDKSAIEVQKALNKKPRGK